MLRAAWRPLCTASCATPGSGWPSWVLAMRSPTTNTSAAIGHRQILLDPDAPGAVERHAEVGRERARPHARGPQHGARGDGLGAELDEVGAEIGDRRAGPHLDAQALQLLARLGRQLLGKRRQAGAGRPRSGSRASCADRSAGSRAPACARRSRPARPPARRRSARRRSPRTSSRRGAPRGAVSSSAASKARRMRRRMSSASPMVFSPGA